MTKTNPQKYQVPQRGSAFPAPLVAPVVLLLWYSVLWKHLAFNVCLVLEIQWVFSFNTDFANVYFTGVYLSVAVLTMYFLFYISKKYLLVYIKKKKLHQKEHFFFYQKHIFCGTRKTICKIKMIFLYQKLEISFYQNIFSENVLVIKKKLRNE